jgi:hypothetical protein
MGLSPEQAKKIDEALETLKASLIEELQNLPAPQRPGLHTDDAFLQKIVDTYFSCAGLADLLLDSGLLGTPPGENCVCGLSCATPGKSSCGTGSW